MKRLMWVLPAVGALVLSARPATGQVYFDNNCVSGSFTACASVRVFSSGNTLRMQIWNLQGVVGDQSTLTSVGLYHLGTAWSGTYSLTGAAYVTSAGSTNILSYWNAAPSDINTLGGINVEVAGGTSGNNGVVGCTDPGGGTHWSTCASFPGVPYVELTFNLSQAFSMEGLALRWHAQQGPNGQSLKCDTGGAGDYGECSPNVVPEPVTIALLASGLAGLGGVGILRRRRKNVLEGGDRA